MERDCSNILKIQNIVAAGTVADSIDLTLISNTMKDCRFSKKNFPGAVCYLQNPKSVALIFATGKVVLTGILRQEDIKRSLKNLLHLLRKNGVTCHAEPQVTVRNIVCTYNIGMPCNLNRIVVALMDREWVEYEPESFPGLVCRISDPKLVFLLFSSGKTVITGGTDMPSIVRGLDIFRKKLGTIGVL